MNEYEEKLEWYWRHLSNGRINEKEFSDAVEILNEQWEDKNDSNVTSIMLTGVIPGSELIIWEEGDTGSAYRIISNLKMESTVLLPLGLKCIFQVTYRGVVTHVWRERVGPKPLNRITLIY